jgi:hypothetical protein
MINPATNGYLPLGAYSCHRAGMVIIIEGHVPQGVRVQVPPSALDMAPRGNWLNGKNNHLRRGARYGVMINRKGAHGYVAWTTM